MRKIIGIHRIDAKYYKIHTSFVCEKTKVALLI